MAKIKSILCLCSILLLCACSHFSKKPDYSALEGSEYGEAAPTYGLKSQGDPWSSANHNELYSAVLSLYQINGLLNCNGSSSCSPAINSDISALLGVQFTGTYAVGSIPWFPSNGDVILINDGDSPCDTSTGLGSFKYFLRYNGSTWDCLGDGGSGAVVTSHGTLSSNTAFDSNLRHTLTVGGSFTASINWNSTDDYQWAELLIMGDASSTITWPIANWSFNTEPTQPFAAKYQIVRFVTYNAGSTVFGLEVGSDME